MTAVARSSLAALVAAILFVIAGSARAAFEPPPQNAHHVVDTAGKLTDADVRHLDDKLERYWEATTNDVAVVLFASLDGDTIEDACYHTARAWKLGDKGKDNGVLLCIAPNERAIWIATGKGVGGDLTDLQSNDIVMHVVAPRLKRDQFREGVDEGTDAIIDALGGPDGGGPVRRIR